MANLRVSVNHLREGMVIINEIRSLEGDVLVEAGTPVTKDVIDVLTKHFVDRVIVSYGEERGIFRERQRDAPHERHDTRGNGGKGIPFGERQGDAPHGRAEIPEGARVAEDAFSESVKMMADGRQDVELSALADTLNEIIRRQGVSELLSRMRRHGEGLYVHAASTAALSLLLARWTGCREEEAQLAAATGLLHDIGYVEMPKGKCDGFASREELETVTYEQHVILGYNLIKNLDIHFDVKQAVLTHHERVDGSGYPLQVPLLRITKISRIVAVADTYDTLMAEEQRKKEPSKYNALLEMQKIGLRRLDSSFLAAFLHSAAEDMLHRTVRLSDGRIGQVSMLNKYDALRPMVRVDGAFVDLAKKKGLSIEEFA